MLRHFDFENEKAARAVCVIIEKFYAVELPSCGRGIVRRCSKTVGKASFAEAFKLAEKSVEDKR